VSIFDNGEPSETELFAHCYVLLRDALRDTMTDPDRWDGEDSEISMLLTYAKHLGSLLALCSEHIKACAPPDIVNGMDLCPCGSGPSWPCPKTLAAWELAGLEADEQVHLILSPIITAAAEAAAYKEQNRG
jgi:hypothetical protein